MKVRPTDEEIDETGEAATIDASTSITPDPFLAEVARIPERPAIPTADATLPAGEQVGRFVIISEIGRGGMGVVYAAEDPTLGRAVAIKMLPPTGDEGRRKRFLREARAAAALSHPGIAVIYEIGEARGRVFIAMELVRGKTLRARLDEGPVPIGEAIRIGREIARALSRAHERGVIHRDLKPENVMLAEDGAIKLLDFGLAKPVSSEDAGLGTATTATAHGRIIGTPMYMSPEQAKGRDVDTRSDVFSLGVMLYELVTGQRPFAGGTVVEIFIALDRDEPAPPSKRNREVSRALERVILRALQKDPAARYPDAGALFRDLAPIAARPSRRARGGAIAAAVLAIAAAIAAIVVLPGRMGEAPKPKPVAMTDLPDPAGTKPEAVAAYRLGLQAFRDGHSQKQGFLRALEIDPDLAAAHAQLVTTACGHAMEFAREHFRKATAGHDRLTERDRVMLHAFEPIVQRQPADWAESNRRFAAALERYPGDAELWHLLGLGRVNYDSFEAAVEDQKKAVEIDPKFAQAYASLGMALAYLGRLDDALQTLDRCLAVAPASIACMRVSYKLRATRGECVEMEGVARRMIAAGAPAHTGYPMLAEALAARGAPLTSVREALRQAEKGFDELPATALPESLRKHRKVGLTAPLSELEGDFEAVLRLAEEYAPAVEASREQSEHGTYARAVAQLYLEVGRDADAGRVALDFLDRRDAWEPAPAAEDVALGGDATPYLLRVALHAGVISRADFEARRDAFRQSWEARVTPVSRNYLWLHGYAAMVDDEADARAALAALPKYLPIPPFRPESNVDADVARTYLLAGRVDEAIAWLERAAGDCGALRNPIDHALTRLLLGEARAKKGDVPGACAALRQVTARWSQAKPRSVTAERARAQQKALGCAD